MRRLAVVLGFSLITAASVPALADTPSALPPLPPPPTSTAAPAPAPVAPSTTAPTPAPQTPATVVAMSGAADAASALAKAAGLGAPVPPETAQGVTGEDAASSAALGDLARRLNTRALVVVHMENGLPVARVFRADAGAFDATTYVPDDATTLQWGGAAQAIARSVGSAPPAPPAPVLQAPPLATHEQPAPVTEPPKKRAFYESGWFWGALGAAAFAGGAVYFATRDNGPTPIHLEMQVPH